MFRRLPVGRTICPTNGGNGRGQARQLMALPPSTCLCPFDRGYPGYAFVKALVQPPDRHFIIPAGHKYAVRPDRRFLRCKPS
ncbi:MAG: hypothetical protein PHR16_16820 [Methylovulum sp.]|nr:hypothetical protein [Methylovulum sp.]